MSGIAGSCTPCWGWAAPKAFWGTRWSEEVALFGHPVIGGSWEGFCIEALLAAAPAGTEPYFYRTSAGAELDLVLRLPAGDIWAIEIKRTTAPKVSRGFHTSAEDIKANRKFLVYAGQQDVPVAKDIRALPLDQATRVLSEF